MKIYLNLEVIHIILYALFSRHGVYIYTYIYYTYICMYVFICCECYYIVDAAENNFTPCCCGFH